MILTFFIVTVKSTFSQNLFKNSRVIIGNCFLNENAFIEENF